MESEIDESAVGRKWGRSNVAGKRLNDLPLVGCFAWFSFLFPPMFVGVYVPWDDTGLLSSDP